MSSDAEREFDHPLTDKEWREFQAIPEQGYSHRYWVNYRIQERIEWERSRPVAESQVESAAAAIHRTLHPNADPAHAGTDAEFYREAARAALTAGGRI